MNQIKPVVLSQDELFPCYDFGPAEEIHTSSAENYTNGRWGVVVDVDEETLARWRSVMDAWEEVQQEISAVWKLASK